MTDSFRSLPDAAVRFFDNYLISLAKASVPEKQRRWYVKRIEDFIKAHSGCEIKFPGNDSCTRLISYFRH